MSIKIFSLWLLFRSVVINVLIIIIHRKTQALIRLLVLRNAGYFKPQAGFQAFLGG